MALITETGRFFGDNATGSQIITLTGALAARTPKLILLWYGRYGDDANEFGPHSMQMFGAADGTRQWCHYFSSIDGQTANQNNSLISTDRIITLTGLTGTVNAIASFTGFGVGSFEIDWSDASNEDFDFICIDWDDGDDIFAEVNSVDLASGTGSATVTLATSETFKAGLAFMSRPSTTKNTVDTTSDAGMSIGAFISSSARWCRSFAAQDAAGTSNVWSEMASDCIAITYDDAGVQTRRNEVDFTSWADGSFDVSRVVGDAAVTMSFIVFGGTDLEVDIGTETTRNGAGTKQTTGIGFPLQLLFLSGTADTALDTQTDGYNCFFGVANDNGENRSLANNETNGQATMVGAMSVMDNACIHYSTGGTPTRPVIGDLDSIGSDDFTINYSVADATQRQFGYLALKGADAATSIVPQDLVQIVVLDNVGITQNHVLASDGLAQLVTLDNVPVLQNHVLSTADLVQLVVLDGSTVVHFTAITPADLAQLVVLDAATIELTYPYFINVGSVGTTQVPSTTLDVPYPSDVVAGNLIIMYIGSNPGTSDDPTTPTDWGLIASCQTGGGGVGEQFVYYKVATGGESGNLAVTVPSNNQGFIGWMAQFGGPSAGVWTIEAVDDSQGSDGTVEMNTVATGGNGRLALAFIGISQESAREISSSTGETGGDWVEVFEHQIAFSSGWSDSMQSASMFSGGTLSGGTSTHTSNRWLQITFAIYKETAVTLTPAGLIQLVVLDPTSISQNHVLTSADLVQLVVLDNDTITQNHVLTPERIIANWDVGYERSMATVRFDGVNDKLTRENGFTGLADGRQGSFSCWIDLKSSKVAPFSPFFFGNGNTWNWYIGYDPFWRNIFVQLGNGTDTFFFSSNVTRVEVQGGLTHLLISWDTNFSAGNKLARFAINGRWVQSLFVTDTSPAFDIDYTDHVTFAGEWWTLNYLGDMGANHIWFDDVYIDFSLDSNISKFINQHTLLPVDLGADGSTPTGSQPILYSKGPASSIATNLGSGGDWTITGSLTDETSWLTGAPVPATLLYSLLTTDVAQLVFLDNDTITQTHVLTSADLIQLVFLDNATITQNHVLVSADLVQLVVLDNATLVQTYSLLAAEMVQVVAMEYCPVGAYFSGSAGWLEQNISGAGTPVPNGRSGSFAALFRLETDVGLRMLATGGQGAASWQVQTNDTFRVALGGSGGSFVFQTTATIVNDGEYHLILASWDTDHGIGSKLAHLVLDGVIDTVNVIIDNLPAFDINYAQGDNWWTVAANTLGTLKFQGDIAYIWFVEPYIDFSLESNIRKFIDAQGRPVPLGFDGSAPLGAQPALYVAGPYNNIANNRGYIGGLPQFGSITASSADPVCGNPTYITQNHVLTSDDLVQLVFLDNVTVVEVGDGTLVVADLVHVVVLDNDTLTQTHILVSTDLAQLVVLDNATIIQTHVITTDDLAQIVTLDSATLAQLHTVVAADLVQLVFLDNTTLLQNHILTSDGLVQLVVLDSIAFAQTHVLAASDLIQIVVLDNATLTQAHVIVSDDLVQLVFLDNVDTGGTVSLSVGGLVQIVTLDQATISQNQLLTSNDLVQQVFLDNAPITQAHLLSSDDLVQAVVLDNNTLTQTHALTSDDLVQVVVLDEATLAQLHTLTAADLAQQVFLDNIALAQLSVLIADDLTQTVELDGNFITQVHAITAESLTQLVFLDGLTDTLFPGQGSVQPPLATIVVSGGPNTIIVATDTSPIIVLGTRRVSVVEGGKSRVYVFDGPRNFEVGSED